MLLLGCTDTGSFFCDALDLQNESCELLRAIAKFDQPAAESENYVAQGQEKFQIKQGLAIYKPAKKDQPGSLVIYALPTALNKQDIQTLVYASEKNYFLPLANRANPVTGKAKNYPFTRVKLVVQALKKPKSQDIREIQFSSFNLFGHRRTEQHSLSFDGYEPAFEQLDFTFLSGDRLHFQYHDQLAAGFKPSVETKIRIDFDEIPLYTVK